MFSIVGFIRPSGGEWLVILLVVALLFGIKRLPELGRSIGAAVRNFQRSFRGDESETPPTDKS